MSTDITFRPLTDADIPLLHAWLNNPNVAEWYGLGIENETYPTMQHVIDNYSVRIRGDQPTFCYIIEADGRPAGLIQAYRIGDYPIYARALDYDDDAWGIDLFIGEDDARRRLRHARPQPLRGDGSLLAARRPGRRHRPEP